jgi:hypothetical protein
VSLVGNDVNATLSGDGFTLTVTGDDNSVALTSEYSSATIGGQSNTVSFVGTTDTVALGGENNLLQILGADAQVTVSGTGQDVQLSGGTVSVADGAQVTFDGTDHNSTGLPDYGNGNIIDLGNSATLTVTGSENWVQASSGDTITFGDIDEGVGASGTGNTVTFTSTGGYAEMSGGTLPVAAGQQASLTGDGNTLVAGGDTTLAVSGDDNTIKASGTASTISVTGTGDSVGMSGGSLDVTAPTAAPTASFAVKGFAYDSYSDGEFETPASADSLQSMGGCQVFCVSGSCGTLYLVEGITDHGTGDQGRGY